MKKTFLLLTMTLLFFIGSGAFDDVKAQTTESTVTIPADAESLAEAGNAQESGAAPINNNYQYSISQIYYTSGEINRKEDGVIKGISFKTKDNNENNYPYTREIEIYLVNTINTAFSSKLMMQFSESDLYFKGNVEFSAEAWVTITLDKAFTYKGGNNVLICVNDKYYSDNAPDDGKDYVSPTAEFYAYTSGNTMRCLNHKNTSSTYDPTNTSITNLSSIGNTGNLPFIQFTFEEQQQDPIALIPSSTNITTCDTVTFNVTQGEGTGTGTDVTNSATIYQVDGTVTIELDGNTFAPSEAGTYEFYAVKGSVQSDTIKIEVTEAPYILNATSKSIWNDGEDYTTFSIKQCKEEVAVDDFIFYVNGEAIDGNTFSTTEAGKYTVYAMNTTGAKTEEITVYASEWKVVNMIATTDLVLEEYIGEYYNTAEIYNGEFRLWVAITGDNYDNGIIINNNVYKYQLSTGVDAYMERSGHRPTTPQPLSIPESIYVESIGKITITEIDHNVFYNVFEGDDTGYYQRTGNSLNDNISSLTIPSTITKIGINAFGFDMCDNFVITCNAETPPTLCWEVTDGKDNEWETPFGNYHASNPGNYGGQYNTVDGTIDGENVSTYLYVPASSLDAYKQADCWKWFYRLVADESTMIKYNGNGDWLETANWSIGAVPTENDAVIINGNVVVSTDVTIGSITINEGCSVTVDAEGVFRVNADVINNGEIITIEDGGQLYYNASDDLVVTVKKGIKGYGDDDSVRDGWYAISSPVYAGVDNNYYFENIENVVNLIPAEEEERKYDLYRYFEMGEYDVNTDKYVSWWENHKMDEYYDWNNTEFTTLSLGRGYLYASSEDVTLEFTNSVKSGEVPFNCTASYCGENESFVGFNLIGNPFPHNITAANIYGLEMAEAYYTLSNSGMWTSNLFSDEAEIKVGEAILVKVAEEGDLKFLNAATRRGFVNNGSIAINVSNGKYTDNAIVNFSEGMGLNKYPHFNKEAQEVYIIDNDTRYGVATMNNDAASIEVGFKANTMGQYTIAAQAKDCKFNSMTLTDKMTGVKTNLLTDSYTFMATTNDNPNRFTLTLNNDNDVDNDFIYIDNNEMIINNIEGDGLVQIYDVMGRSVATYNVSGSANISMETLSNGVYIVRMTDDNGVKTQKVVNN